MNKPKTREELLKYFDGMCNLLAIHGWTERDGRAVAIRQLIQNQPEVDEELFEIKAQEYERGLKDAQPEITMKDIDGWADEIRERVTNHKDWGYAADTIKDMVEEEFGIKVKK